MGRRRLRTPRAAGSSPRCRVRTLAATVPAHSVHRRRAAPQMANPLAAGQGKQGNPLVARPREPFHPMPRTPPWPPVSRRKSVIPRKRLLPLQSRLQWRLRRTPTARKVPRCSRMSSSPPRANQRVRPRPTRRQRESPLFPIQWKIQPRPPRERGQPPQLPPKPDLRANRTLPKSDHTRPLATGPMARRPPPLVPGNPGILLPGPIRATPRRGMRGLAYRERRKGLPHLQRGPGCWLGSAGRAPQTGAPRSSRTPFCPHDRSPCRQGRWWKRCVRT